MAYERVQKNRSSSVGFIFLPVPVAFRACLIHDEATALLAVLRYRELGCADCCDTSALRLHILALVVPTIPA